MFAIIAGLMAILVVLGATANSRFDGSKIEKALVGLLCLPMQAFGNAEFSKGSALGVASVALIGLLVSAGGLPLLLSFLFLGAAAAAFWDENGDTLPAIVVAKEYLDDEDLARLIELGERGTLLRLEDEREAARLRIAELEADNFRLVARVAELEQAVSPSALELMARNKELRHYVEVLFDATDCPDPGWRPVIAHA